MTYWQGDQSIVCLELRDVLRGETFRAETGTVPGQLGYLVSQVLTCLLNSLAMKEPQPLGPLEWPRDPLVTLGGGGTEDGGKDHPVFASWSKSKGFPRTLDSEVGGEPLNTFRIS